MADDTGTMDMTQGTAPPPPDFSSQFTAPQPQNDPTQAQPQPQQPPPQNGLNSLQQNDINAQNYLAGNTPSRTDADVTPVPPDVQEHMSGIHRAIDSVRDALGGTKHYSATVDKNGNMSITQTDSTNKEKWMNIAALALGGAVKGFAAGQGPGGAGRALGAGMDFGQQQAQAQKQKAQQDVQFGNQQLLAQANLAHIKQVTYLTGQQAKMAGLQYSKEVSDEMSNFEDKLAEAPGNTDWGVIDPTDPNALTKLKNKNPGLVSQITGSGGKHIITAPRGDGTVHAITVNNDWMNQDITEPWDLPIPGVDDNGRATLKHKTVLPGTGQTPQKLITASLQNMNQVAQAQQRQAAADKADADKPENITDYQKAYGLAAQQTDPVKKKQYQDLGDELYRKAQGLRAVTNVNVGAPGVTPSMQISDMIKPGGPFAPGTIDGTNAQKLASGDITLGELPKRGAKGMATPQQTVAAAEAYSQQLYGLGYSDTEIAQEKKFFDQIKVQGTLDGIDKMIGVGGSPSYLDTVVNLAKAAGIGPTAPLNQVEQAIRKTLGDDAAKNFQTALGEVQRTLPTLIGNPLLGGSDSDMKLKAAEQMFGQNPTLSNLTSTATTLKSMMQGSVDSYSRNNRFLQRRYGKPGAYTAQFSPTHASTATTQTAATGGGGGGARGGGTGGGTNNVVPVGKVPWKLKDGTVVGYSDDKEGKVNYHAF